MADPISTNQLMLVQANSARQTNQYGGTSQGAPQPVKQHLWIHCLPQTKPFRRVKCQVVEATGRMVEMELS